MTFVNRSPKWVIPPLEETPGPGAYSSTHPKQQPAASSCFLSKTGREEGLHNQYEVGPGSYNLAKDYNKQTHTQPVFRSKIERFLAKKEPQSSPHSDIEQKFEELIKYTEQHKATPGKLITFNQRREFQKKLMPQNLPSIPTQECSFGYRYDQASKKLVQNQNPKIIFAKVLSSTNEDFFFQRTQSYMGKGLHFSIEKNVKRPSPELKYQLGLPDPTKYHPDLTTSLPSTNPINAFVSSQQRFQDPASPKDLLKLQRLKRQFKDYIPKDVDLKDLEEARQQFSSYGSEVVIRKGKNAQCFLSKIDRFKQRKTAQKEGERQKLHLKIAEKPAEKEQKEGTKAKPKKQPYGLGQPRFKEKGKQNLGPGYYEIKPAEPNAANLDHKEERFKTENLAHDMPGPGAYDIQPSKPKEKPKIPFTRYVCNNDRDKHRFSSMQSLYEEIGKQLNYENKVERQVVKVSPERPAKPYEVYRKDLDRMRELVK